MLSLPRYADNLQCLGNNMKYMVSPEKSNSPEKEALELLALIEKSKDFLGGQKQWVGEGFSPLRIPMSGLFRRDGEPVVVGYKLKGDVDTSVEASDVIQLASSVEDLLSKLKRYSLWRSKSQTTSVRFWQGPMSLTEYRPARLVGRRVEPIGEQYVYDMQVRVDDSEGRTHYPHERIVYSSLGGVIWHEHRNKEMLGTTVHEEASITAPRGVTYYYEPNPLV